MRIINWWPSLVIKLKVDVWEFPQNRPQSSTQNAMMKSHLKAAGLGEVDLGLLKLLALLKAPPPSCGLTITEQASRAAWELSFLLDCCILWTARLFKGGYCKHFKRSRFTRFTRITQFTRLIRKRQIRQNHQKRTDSPESPDSLEPPDSPENKQIHQNRSIFPQPSWTFHGEFAQFSLSSVCVVCA